MHRKSQFEDSGGGMEEIGGGKAIFPTNLPFSDNFRNRNQSKTQKLILHVISDPTKHPNLAFQNGVGLRDLHLQAFVEIRVFPSPVANPRRNRLVRIVSEREFDINILVFVDAYVVNIPGVVNIDVENS